MNINNLTLPKPPFEPVDTTELFRGKRVILFGLPGAFTPTCSTKQLPGYESMFEMFRSKGIDMMKWFKSQDIKNVQYIADGSGILANR